MTARREYHETASLHVVDGGDLVIKVVRDVTTCFLFGWHLFGKAAHAVKNADDLRRRAQRRLERSLPDAAGRESVIGDDSRLWRHHQRQTRIQNSLAVERAKLSLPDAAYAKSILTADIKRDFLFKRATVLLKEPNHTAKMIVMSVAQDHCVERGWIDPDDCHVIVEDLGRESEVDQHVTLLAIGEGLRVQREAPFGVQDVSW